MINDWIDMEFDEEKWENMINSDELLTKTNSSSIDDIDIIQPKHDILKLSSKNFQRTIFGYTDKYFQTNRTMSILISPSSRQRVRYENECKHILRYISIPNNGTLTIEFPNLQDILYPSDTLWLRITRTTINYQNNNFVFFHPYPLWIRNSDGIIHHGSIYIPITDNDINHGLIQINGLAMIRLKQNELKTIKTLNIYSTMNLNYFHQHQLEIQTAKQIRDIYQLQKSILNFQIVRIDEKNIAYPTDCYCQTEILEEFEANHFGKKSLQNHRMKMKILKKISRKKKKY